MTVQFISLSSGSCGNCYFLVCKETGMGVLIDAGVSFRKMKKTLESYGYGLDNICALFVTHDHFDHIRNLDYFCGKMSRPVYATSVLHNALANHPFAALKATAVRRNLAEGEWNDVDLFLPSGSVADGPVDGSFFEDCPVAPETIRVRPFVVPHDATQTVGYAFDFFGCNFVIMTDVGKVTPEALTLASAADSLVIESNYDIQMLIAGPYPKELRDRIVSGHGHLSNDECAEALTRVWHPGLDNIFLCHLSENNNTPELAFAASRDALDSVLPDGVSCSLRCLPRRFPSQLFTLKS